MIPKIYDKNERYIGLLPDATRGVTIEERNGMFEAELEYQLFSPNWDKLVRGNIIVVHANDTLLNQKFRIYKIGKTIRGKFTVYAKHISYDMQRDMIEGLDISNQSCEYCLNMIFRNSQFSQKFKGHSDIINAQNFKIGPTKLLSAIGGTEGSIIDTFGTGAELLRDNENIHVLNKRGNDNGVIIEYAENLTGLDITEDEDGLITRIRAKAKYTPEGGEETEIFTYIDSSYIFEYETPFIGEIDFSDKFEDGEIPTVEKLTKLGEAYFRDNKCDILEGNYKIQFIPLSKCAGYEDIEDKISLCDTVTIKDYRYNLDTKAKVIKATYDFLRERYESMEVGQPRTTLGDVVGGGDSNKGEQGPPGPQGPPGKDGNIGDFPDSLPSVPVLSSKLYGFANIELSWTFENKVYYQYELYASKTKDFKPNVFDIIHQGQTSSFLFQAKPNETWYFRVCAVNSYGNRTEFSNQIAVTTKKIDDLSNYVDNMAIGEALIGTLSLDRGWIGKLNANYLDVKGNFSVTDGNGKRTMDIDSFGNVSLDVTSFKLNSTDINKVINNVYDSKTQLDIFNKLTNNGQAQGIYLQDGKLYLNGAFLKANSINAESINIGDYTNFITLSPNSTFQGTSGMTQGYEIASIAGNEKYNHVSLSNKLYSLNGGDKFRIKGFFKGDLADSKVNITCCWRNSNNEIVTSSTLLITIEKSNTWTEINNIITVPSRPSGASYVNFKINIQEGQYRRIYIDRFSISKMIAGELVVDGLIDGKQIKGVTIVGGELRGSSNFYTAPDENSPDGYAFRIYSSGELHSNNFILTSKGNNYARLMPDGTIGCTQQVNSPAIISSGQSLWLGIRSVTPGSESNFNFELTQQADKNVYFRPGYNGQAILGHSAKMFNKVFAVNGISSSSDRTLKENIQYLSNTYNSKALMSEDITEEDLYNFIRDDLITAIFNFKDDDRKHIGFIAQDLLYNVDGSDNKVGQLIVNKPDDERSPLNYNEKIYTNVIAGALRNAILKFEKRFEELEKKIYD